MPRKLTHALSPIDAREVELDCLTYNDTDWVVWWYGGIFPSREDLTLPRVRVCFCKLNNGWLDDELFTRDVPLNVLGQLRVGTLWRHRRVHAQIAFETRDCVIDTHAGKWSFTSFKSMLDEGLSAPYPWDIHPLKYRADRNWLLQFDLPEGGKLLVPCLEYFYRTYGHSAELKQLLLTMPWVEEQDPAGSAFYAPLRGPEQLGQWSVNVPTDLKDEDAVFLAHAKYNPYTRRVAKDIFDQVQRGYDSRMRQLLFLRVQPWFEARALLRVSGIAFDQGRSFLALQVNGGSLPLGLPIRADRQNVNRVEYDEEDETNAARDQEGGGAPVPRKVSDSQPLEITQSQPPDTDGARAQLKDPPFAVLGEPPEVTYVWHKRARGADSRLRPPGTEVTTFSGGDPHGRGKGVGHVAVSSSLTLESQGMLRDVWNAMRYLQRHHSSQLQNVEWFTFEQGFSESAEPKLIPLEPFDPTELKIPNDVRQWVYLDPVTRVQPRGVLIARLTTPDLKLYIAEIQRRPVRRASEGSKLNEERFLGIAFTLHEEAHLSAWLRHLLSEVRQLKGLVRGMSLNSKPPPNGFKYFKHVPAKNEPVHAEAAVRHALSKHGIELP